ncbi:LysR family transcriptional regulator [Curvibacter sp. RS43]|uniref:LysR family transcriptional regulator n=1 Tax=Curvibacter microcysteis TaxID=3026419 RepID=UPI002363138D|nr:LysR family transcriptional regulator [Curvibacter sp. RS43]MDD0812875.1 LysR family transcriptional regulator [Curvibacter sp. RS43]
MLGRILQEPAVRYFLEVARTGSVTEAALKLSVAPSAVSRQIARLESDLDTLLFERRARGMVLNAAGELLVAHAQRVEQDIERVTGEIGSLKGLRAGTVRIVSVASGFLPGLIARFHARYPGFKFYLEVCPKDEIPRRVRDGEADIGITLSGIPEARIRVELRHPSPVLAVMAFDHPLAGQLQLSLSQAAGYPLALPPKYTSLRQLLDVSCGRQGLQYNVVFESNQVDALVSYVEASGAIAFYGEASISARLKGGSIKAIPLRDREMNERHVEIQTMANRNLPAAVRAFTDFLVLTLKSPA